MRSIGLVLWLVGCGRHGFDQQADAHVVTADVAIVDVAPPDAPAQVPDDGASVIAAPFTLSNAVDPMLVTTELFSASLGPGSTCTIDTDSGTIIVDGAEIRAPGEGVIAGLRYVRTASHGIFVMRSAAFAAGSTLRGVGDRSLILVIGEGASFEGVVDVSAGRCSAIEIEPRCGGPGGGDGAIAATVAGGCGPGGPGGANDPTGGGGGGFSTAGAAGGIGIIDQGGPAGAMCAVEATTALAGGSGGGVGGHGTAAGGGGGGAIQVSVYGTVTIAGTILASGAGGRGGSTDGGGGGGSGGTILIEATAIEANGILAANGGGGGAGGAELDGEAGRADTTAAMGGGSGGDGGARDLAPTTGDFAIGYGGGGGGAVGAIVLRSDSVMVAPVAKVSPVPTLLGFP